ncbi:MAG TPA: SIMPL domain-containing protein [Sphingomonas sp.]|jgi:hypothetical protein|nr:SIMPL domain-containing protein [Sphingomonas sp.]
MKTLMLFAAAIAAAPAAAQGPGDGTMPTPATGAMLDVSATGRTTRVPDQATLRAGVVTQGATAAAALGDNAQRMARMLAALKRAGVAPRDIATASVALSPQYRYQDGQAPTITGYQATNTVQVRFRDVTRSGAILDTLVGQGANQVDGPTLAISTPDAALDEARVDALARARARADLYARNAGLRVVRIVSIVEVQQDAGGGDPPMPMMVRAQKSDSTQVAAGEKDVSVTLAVRFELR